MRECGGYHTNSGRYGGDAFQRIGLVRSFSPGVGFLANSHQASRSAASIWTPPTTPNISTFASSNSSNPPLHLFPAYNKANLFALELTTLRYHTNVWARASLMYLDTIDTDPVTCLLPSSMTWLRLRPLTRSLFHKRHHHISTLDPSKLLPSDHISLSGLKSRLQPEPETSTIVSYLTHKGLPVPFPRNTKGFFYLHVPTSSYDLLTGEPYANARGEPEERPVHPAAAALRFRVLDKADPGAFWSEGRDLAGVQGHRFEEIRVNGKSIPPTCPPENDALAWQIPLLVLHKSTRYQELYTSIVPKSIQERVDVFLKSALQHPDWKQLTTEPNSKTKTKLKKDGPTPHTCYNKHTTFLPSILSPFLLDFSCHSVKMALIDPEGVWTVHLKHIFVVQPVVSGGSTRSGAKESSGPTMDENSEPAKKDENKIKYKSPYTGKGICRFELVDVAYKGGIPPVPHLAIRVLEWVDEPSSEGSVANSTTPIIKDSTSLPVTQTPSELLRRYDPNTDSQRLWLRRDLSFLSPSSLRILEREYRGRESVVAKRVYAEGDEVGRFWEIEG